VAAMTRRLRCRITLARNLRRPQFEGCVHYAWTRTTLNRRKIHALKNPKPVMCWLAN
jgi:hypothetical protein